MAGSFKYWDDCLDPLDMEAMWTDPEVSKEWIDAGENKGQKVHLSRDPDGQPYLTQTEMKAVAAIIVRRHFVSQIDPDMICAIAELESDRQPLAMRYNRKTKETSVGIMQMLPKTAVWLVSEMGYRTYEIEGNLELLHRPFISVYFGAAYLKWLSSYDGKDRNEEFVVRAYRGGPKKATHKSTLDYWRRYLSVKQSLPSRRAGDAWRYWDSRVSPEDMEELWRDSDVLREWTKSGEKRGKVRFPHDAEKRPYLSRLEVKAVAEIIVSKHFSESQIRPTALAALAEVSSMRFVDGVGSHTGIMGIDYQKALWLYREFGYKAYKVNSVEDLSNPFTSMYFAAAYLVWLSKYEGRERTPQFVIQAYLGGPENVNLQESGPLWLKFEQALSYYEDPKKIREQEQQGSCSIL
ncbi:Lytic transglycosylase-like SLT domain [Macleaya cordata]|uniref:Lytic transglycosylase-like SLT domain n=1 Tax=Macleaya cordata TaxID=56857 RepID=A0A200PY92_MACCD|nr:Lytic transglycosylase-like SLT domain [Macleaya cordata]